MPLKSMLFIPTKLVKSAQKVHATQTIWWVNAPDGPRHRWKVRRNACLGLDNLLDWLTLIATDNGAPLEVTHRSGTLNHRILVSATVTHGPKKEASK